MIDMVSDDYKNIFKYGMELYRESKQVVEFREIKLEEASEKFRALLDESKFKEVSKLPNPNRRLGIIYGDLKQYKIAEGQFLEAIKKSESEPFYSPDNSYLKLPGEESETKESLLAWTYHDLGCIYLIQEFLS